MVVTNEAILRCSCCCGRLDSNHQPEAMRHIPSSEVTWDASRHTVEEPTNAYGEMEFTGAGQTSRAKVRIAKVPEHRHQ